MITENVDTGTLLKQDSRYCIRRLFLFASDRMLLQSPSISLTACQNKTSNSKPPLKCFLKLRQILKNSVSFYTTLKFSSAYHLQINCQTKVVNHLHGDMMQSVAGNQPKNRNFTLPHVEFTNNIVFNRSTSRPSLSRTLRFPSNL